MIEVVSMMGLLEPKQLLEVAVAYIDRHTQLVKPKFQTLNHIDRAMLPARAANSYGEIRLSLTFVQGQKRLKQGRRAL